MTPGPPGAAPQAAAPRALRAVAGITAVSGVLLVACPGWMLGELTPRTTALARHLFGTVGMFMVVSGGTMHRALSVPSPDPGLLTWAALQKLGASAAMGIGVRRGVYAPRALSVAAFDLASGLGCLAYLWHRGRPGHTGPGHTGTGSSSRAQPPP